MDKAAIFQALLTELRQELARRQDAAREAAQGATDEESKAEDKYDTRATESSYLARGQAMQVEELSEDLRILEGFNLPANCSVARPGALVEVDMSGDQLAFFLLPRAGGLDTKIDGMEITVITPMSPIGEQIQGRFAGDSFAPHQDGPADCKIVSIS